MASRWKIVLRTRIVLVSSKSPKWYWHLKTYHIHAILAFFYLILTFSFFSMAATRRHRMAVETYPVGVTSGGAFVRVVRLRLRK